MKKLFVGLSAASVAAMPVAASAVEASVQPTTAPVAGENELGGESIGVIIALLAAAGTIIAIIVSAEDDDEPTSP